MSTYISFDLVYHNITTSFVLFTETEKAAQKSYSVFLASLRLEVCTGEKD